MSDKNYSEDQVQKILARSLRLQEAARVTKGNESGFSIEELEEIALEVGIEPEFLREALDTETDSFVLKQKHGKLYPKQLELSGNVRAPMTDECMFDIVQLLRSELGTPSMPAGALESLGSSFEWATLEHGFSARSGPEETDFKMVYKAGNGKGHHFAWLWMALAFIPPLLIGITKSVVVGLPVIAIILAALVAMHFKYPSYYEKKRQKTIDVFKQIEELTVQSHAKRRKFEDRTSEEERTSSEEKKIDLEDAEGYTQELDSDSGQSKSQKKRVIP